MNIASEVANDIWENPVFKTDLKNLFKSSLLNDFTDLKATTGELTNEEQIQLATRLLQTAMIFAATEKENFKDIAQRISTAALKLHYSNDSVKTLFSLIQARLKNFPVLLSEKLEKSPPLAPLLLQYEFSHSKANHTVELEGGSKLIFTPFQLEGWKRLNNSYSVAITGPTSAGKSYVLLTYLLEKMKKHDAISCAYIVPTRALINQVSSDAEKEIKQQGVHDINISTAPVDMREEGKHKFLYVLTQERLEALLTSCDDMQLDIVIIDEAQVIADGTRGILLESVIDRIRSKSIHTQFIFSGPLISNPNFFSRITGTNMFAACATEQSPVTQNIIYLNYGHAPTPHVNVSIDVAGERHEVANISTPLNLTTDADKISYLSHLFGRNESSVIYANGKANAEKIAHLISQQTPENDAVKEDLSELVKFVKKHVHKDYGLVGTLEKGIGFHYGHMPSLLRKSLEEHFKEKRISNLVCTSTLLYGLNMPAKNIFMLKPTTGQNSPISGPAFWNLAGRAGRLGKELEGNVFIIDYELWDNRPLSSAKGIAVDSALKTTFLDDSDGFLNYIAETETPSAPNSNYEISLGKLVLDHRMHKLDATLDKYSRANNNKKLREIHDKICQVSELSPLPTEVINKNIGVSVFRQNDLLNYFFARINEIDPAELIPAPPLSDFRVAYQSYLRAFRRIDKYILNYSSSNNSYKFYSSLALHWMRGESLPQLINSSIRYHTRTHSTKSTARIIRETMEDVEDTLRFKYVKYFTCYNSLLEYTLTKHSLEKYISIIPDIPLYLEMGGSSGSMINLMALGLSRSTSESIIEFMPDKDMSVQDVKQWLIRANIDQYDISTICAKEINNFLLNDTESDAQKPVHRKPKM